MSSRTVVILGGGWGGLAVAHHLRHLLPVDDRVQVIEKRDAFSFYPSYPWLMTGERASIADVERPMSQLADSGIEWIHEEVTALDPEALTVTTSSGTLQGDAVVLALGAETSPGDIPGFVEHAHNLYEAQGALDLRAALPLMDRGTVAVLVTRLPFRCPAAPYEAAFLIEAQLRRRGIRDRVEVAVYTPEKQPMPVAGAAVGAALRDMLAARGIRYAPEHVVSRVDGDSRTMIFDGDEAAYDLLIGVPPHRAPRAVREAGLVDKTGYIPVHPQTLELLRDPEAHETHHPGLYAIGDVTSVRLLNGLLLPKAGVFAEGQARVVAENVAARLRGERPAARFDGTGFCYIEVGDGMAAYGAGDFFAYPGPKVVIEPPTHEYKRAKEEFEQVLTTWFGTGRPALTLPSRE